MNRVIAAKIFLLIVGILFIDTNPCGAALMAGNADINFKSTYFDNTVPAGLDFDIIEDPSDMFGEIHTGVDIPTGNGVMVAGAGFPTETSFSGSLPTDPNDSFNGSVSFKETQIGNPDLFLNFNVQAMTHLTQGGTYFLAGTSTRTVTEGGKDWLLTLFFDPLGDGILTLLLTDPDENGNRVLTLITNPDDAKPEMRIAISEVQVPEPPQAPELPAHSILILALISLGLLKIRQIT